MPCLRRSIHAACRGSCRPTASEIDTGRREASRYCRSKLRWLGRGAIDEGSACRSLACLAADESGSLATTRDADQTEGELAKGRGLPKRGAELDGVDDIEAAGVVDCQIGDWHYAGNAEEAGAAARHGDLPAVDQGAGRVEKIDGHQDRVAGLGTTAEVLEDVYTKLMPGTISPGDTIPGVLPVLLSGEVNVVVPTASIFSRPSQVRPGLAASKAARVA